MQKQLSLILLFLLIAVRSADAFEFHWELDETPEGSESTTVIEPVQVILLDEVVDVPSHSASLALMRKYSVHLTSNWTPALAYRLFQTFESIPQQTNNPYHDDQTVPASVWHLTHRHLHNDIEIEYHGEQRIITITADAFTYATPLLAEIEGVRGRYFSKRLHRAVVRFVTGDSTDRHALDRILEKRYAVSVNVPDYEELTRNTTQEHSGRFDIFKNEEIIALVAMLEEYPTGMIKTPGLKYLLRRLDGTEHPTRPGAAAVAWTGAGYIEFMESAFNDASIQDIHRIILHEKAHFLWDHLFDAQLKQEWIEVGGWYKNPDDKDGWSTTKQTEFVSAYAHGKTPNEDMAESISFYIVNPDKLRLRSPAKYEFIRDRIMHGTRYISQIREDLTFQVYNLYPDYVYPGRVIRVDISVIGEPEEDKQILIEIELHKESEMDASTRGHTRITSEKGTTYKDIHFYPVNVSGDRVNASHILKSNPVTLSLYAAQGFWIADQINITDAIGNKRFVGQSDIGWKLYVNNPLADCLPPEYVPNSVRLSLSDALTQHGEAYQILRVQWHVVEVNGLSRMSVALNDSLTESYSFSGSGRAVEKIEGIWHIEANLEVPDYYPTGPRYVHTISMRDIAGNPRKVYFSHYDGELASTANQIDEPPAMIEISTPHPDTHPPVLGLNTIKIQAEPTHPEAPNGETKVGITFQVKDDISGYQRSSFYLRDPHGSTYNFSHNHPEQNRMYFIGDPTLFQTYHATILLPVGSAPGTWGLTEMHVHDKARNTLRADFTEILRFEVGEGTPYDVNADGVVNIQDLVLVAARLGEMSNGKEDVNNDGVVNIQDLVLVANAF